MYHCVSLQQEIRMEPELEEDDQPDPDQEEDTSAPAPKRKKSALDDLLGGTFVAVRVAPKSAHSTAEEEVKRYNKATPLPLAGDPLSWWREHEVEYPLLARFAKRYLCIPGTSVSAERVFSTAGDIVTAQRSALTPDHVDQLLFLNKNIDTKK